jgi:hypothetical protein
MVIFGCTQIVQHGRAHLLFAASSLSEECALCNALVVERIENSWCTPMEKTKGLK